MTDCKTGAEHIKSLKDGRTVYIDGKLVPDVTEHPAFRNSVKSAALLYDYKARPENVELMTFRPDGSNRRINRAWQMPRNYAEMVQRRKRCRRGLTSLMASWGARRITLLLPWSVSAWASRYSRNTDPSARRRYATISKRRAAT